MQANKIVGILIIIVLILSIALVGYSSVNNMINPSDAEKVVSSEHVFEESDLDNEELANSKYGNLTVVNINIHQKTGSSEIEFADNTSTIYDITTKDDVNSSTTVVTTEQNGGRLDVNIDSNDSNNHIILSNKYNYNISGEFVAGGFDVDLSNNAQVDEINVNSTLGGVNIELNGGSLNTLNTVITTGGLNIVGQPNGITNVNSIIEIGGIDIQLTRPVAYIISNIDVGGLNPGDYQQVSENEYKGIEFDSSEDQLIINNTIRVGGVNTQSFSK